MRPASPARTPTYLQYHLQPRHSRLRHTESCLQSFPRSCNRWQSFWSRAKRSSRVPRILLVQIIPVRDETIFLAFRFLLPTHPGIEFRNKSAAISSDQHAPCSGTISGTSRASAVVADSQWISEPDSEVLRRELVRDRHLLVADRQRRQLVRRLTTTAGAPPVPWGPAHWMRKCRRQSCRSPLVGASSLLETKPLTNPCARASRLGICKGLVLLSGAEAGAES